MTVELSFGVEYAKVVLATASASSLTLRLAAIQLPGF